MRVRTRRNFCHFIDGKSPMVRHSTRPSAATKAGAHKSRPADERVTPVADARLHRQVEIVGFVDQARDFDGCLGDVQEQHAPTARDIVVIGHGAVPPCPMGPARGYRVRPR